VDCLPTDITFGGVLCHYLVQEKAVAGKLKPGLFWFIQKNPLFQWK